jgi:hypothetical protein
MSETRGAFARAATVMIHPGEVPNDGPGWRALGLSAIAVFGEDARSYDGGVWFDVSAEVEPGQMVLVPDGFPPGCYLEGLIGGTRGVMA